MFAARAVELLNKMLFPAKKVREQNLNYAQKGVCILRPRAAGNKSLR
jgi:hypothetical protein